MEKVLTTDEVAEMLKCTRQTIINMIDRGSFPNAYKLDPENKSKYFIPLQDVRALVERRRNSQKKSTTEYAV